MSKCGVRGAKTVETKLQQTIGRCLGSQSAIHASLLWENNIITLAVYRVVVQQQLFLVLSVLFGKLFGAPYQGNPWFQRGFRRPFW